LAAVKVRGRSVLLKKPGQESGAALMTPPLKGKCSLVIFSRDAGYTREATNTLSEAGL